MSIILVIIVVGFLFFLIRRKTNGSDVVKLVKQYAKQYLIAKIGISLQLALML